MIACVAMAGDEEMVDIGRDGGRQADHGRGKAAWRRNLSPMEVKGEHLTGHTVGRKKLTFGHSVKGGGKAL